MIPLLAATLVALASLPEAAAMQDRSTWTVDAHPWRRAVWVDAADFTEDLHGFPLTIRLSAAEASACLRRGWAAIDADTGRPVSAEAERFPDGTATVRATVERIPARSAGVRLWLAYGGRGSGPPASQGGVWPGLALRFAPGPALAGEGAPALRIEGRVAVTQGPGGHALDLTGDGIVEIPAPAAWRSQEITGWTLEAVAWDACPDPNRMVGHGLVSLWAEANDREPLVNFGKVGHVTHCDSRRGPDGPWVGATNAGYAPPGRWRHYAATLDLRTGMTATYLDGRPAGTGAAPTSPLPVARVRIGGWRPGAFAFQGRIAEVRITPTVLTKEWLAASAGAALPESGFCQIGPEEARDGPSSPPAIGVPHLLEPEEGATLSSRRPRFRWTLVPGATRYRVSVSTKAEPGRTLWSADAGPLPYAACPVQLPENVPLQWSVRAAGGKRSGSFRFQVSAPLTRRRRPDTRPVAPPRISERRVLLPGDPDGFRAAGVVGDRIRAAVERWALRVPGDNPDLVGMFERQWRSEGWLDFWGESFGKFFQGASLLYRMTGDQRLREVLRHEVSRAIAAQEPSGYLGNLLPERRLYGPGPRGTNWDLYNGHHTMMALLEYHVATGDHTALRAAMRLADLWCDVFGPGKRSIVRDIPGPDQCNLGIVAPLTWLYRLTGRPRYLALARFCVDDLEHEAGPRWISLGLQRKHCTEMRGTHALEQLFVFEGITDLAAVTGRRQWLDSMLHWWSDMTARERMAHGNLAPEELWCNQPWSPTWAETCVATAYVRFSLQALCATGDPRIADRIEEATLNAYFAAQRPDGALWVYQVPVNGVRRFGWYELKPEDPDLGCCFTYALTGMGLIPRWAARPLAGGAQPGLALNYYGAGTIEANVAGQRVRLTQTTAYPVEGRVVIEVAPRRSARWTLALRVPDWSARSRYRVNGGPWSDAQPAAYARLDRVWRRGDVVELELDFTTRIVPGEQATSGRVTVRRGPLLLAADARLNPDWDPNKSPLDLARFALTPRTDPLPGPPVWCRFDVPTVCGGLLTLCDFASAGALGGRYDGWIPAR